MAFGTFTNGLPNPVTNADLQELDVFHNSNDASNKLTSQIFSSDRYKRMYIAHMRTILDEQFANNNYTVRAAQLQQIIDADVVADPNTFYSYTDFTDNLNSSVGVNPVIGISELMNDRITFLQNLPEFTTNPPTVSVLNSNSVLPHTCL